MAKHHWFRPVDEANWGKCERCGRGLRLNPARTLAEHGTPERYMATCAYCGHRQSWAPTLNTGAEQAV